MVPLIRTVFVNDPLKKFCNVLPAASVDDELNVYERAVGYAPESLILIHVTSPDVG